ncbi:MAG: DUF5663 domain-containing protein [bacterium]|nr:DUF5663 domain-containing protein [bacterium]
MINLQQYLNADLFEELGMARLSQEQRVEFLEAFGGVIQQRLTIRLMKELSDEQKEQFDRLLDTHKDDAEALNSFLQKELPHFGHAMKEEIAGYKHELMERMRASVVHV